MPDFEYYFYITASLIIAITIHEYAHAWMADRLGDPTAKYQGRLSLNPLVHLDFMGTLLFILIGFGWGKPVPINASNFKNPAKGDLLVALTGPASNLLLAIFLSGFLRYFSVADPEYANYFNRLCWSIFNYNIILGIFNLLPFPPLDGSHIFHRLIPYSLREYYYQFLEYSPRYFFLFVIVDNIFISKIFGQSILSAILWPLIHGVESLILIGS